jgi:hypothetical protein
VLEYFNGLPELAVQSAAWSRTSRIAFALVPASYLFGIVPSSFPTEGGVHETRVGSDRPLLACGDRVTLAWILFPGKSRLLTSAGSRRRVLLPARAGRGTGCDR